MRETDINNLLPPLRKVHEQVRHTVLSSCEQSALEVLSRVDDDESSGDTLYAIDRISENVLIALFQREIASIAPVVLIGEGLPEGQVVLPSGTNEDDALWRIIVDPIDGTREIMYQKRSAWILTGVAPNLGPETNLQDIVLALQTEIPTLKQHLS